MRHGNYVKTYIRFLDSPALERGNSEENGNMVEPSMTKFRSFMKLGETIFKITLGDLIY